MMVAVIQNIMILAHVQIMKFIIHIINAGYIMNFYREQSNYFLYSVFV